MSNRYGRNQKRAHRARIAELEKQLAEALDNAALWRRIADRDSERARRAEIQARYAVETAFDHFSRGAGLLKMVTEQIAIQVGQGLARELRPHAERFMSAARRPVSLSAHPSGPDAVGSFYRLRVEVPTVACEIAVSHRDLADWRGGNLNDTKALLATDTLPPWRTMRGRDGG